MYDIIDVTEWIYEGALQVSGTREKRWLKSEPNASDIFLFKLPKASSNELWAEKVSSEVGKKLGFKMMDVYFAINADEKGVLLRNFSSGSQTMADGGEILAALLSDFNPESLKHYSIENIIQALEKHPFLKNVNFNSEFIPMCIFDAFIANQDRHCENWALLFNGEPHFAPIYDNGASLGFNSPNEKMKKMIKDQNMLNAFNNRSKTLIEVQGKKKPKVLALLEFLRTLSPQNFDEEINRIFSFTEEDITPILEQVPKNFMNETEKEWVRCLLLNRKKWLYEWYEGVR